MSELTRREALQRLALAIAAAGAHRSARRARSAPSPCGRPRPRPAAYAPKALAVAEFRTLERLTDLIIPADGKPGALQADVAAVDRHAAQRERRAEGRSTRPGLAWLDTTMQSRTAATDFVSATPAQQTALLDLIAYQKNRTPELDRRDRLLRAGAADDRATASTRARSACATSTWATRPQAEFVVPQAAMDHVISRSPLK